MGLYTDNYQRTWVDGTPTNVFTKTGFTHFTHKAAKDVRKYGPVSISLSFRSTLTKTGFIHFTHKAAKEVKKFGPVSTNLSFRSTLTKTYVFHISKLFLFPCQNVIFDTHAPDKK